MRALRRGRWWWRRGRTQARSRGGAGTLGRLLGLALLVSPGLVAGCGDGDALDPPKPVADRDLYWALDLNHHMVLMSSNPAAPDSTRTLQLVATPRNRYGDALAGLGQPTFSSPAPEQLRVSPEGQLTALAPTSDLLPVVATLTVGNLKNVDTVYVAIADNPSPPKLASLSVHPVSPDSAKFGLQTGFGSKLPVYALDSAGNPMPDLLVRFRSSDPTVLTVSGPTDYPSNTIQSVRMGTAFIYANTTAYGIVKADTVPYRIGWPLTPTIFLDKTHAFSPAITTVGVGARVSWAVDGVGDTTDVTFDGADLSNVTSAATWEGWDAIAHVWDMTGSDLSYVFCTLFGVDCTGEGNIATIWRDHGVYRVLRAPGTYNYHSVRYGTSGQIIVVDE